jgi:hypothetical protein
MHAGAIAGVAFDVSIKPVADIVQCGLIFLTRCT